MTLKRLLYEKLYFIYYSVKEIVLDVVNLIEEFKKPRMWSIILYATFFIAVYNRNIRLMWTTLPFIFIVYLIRQKRDTKWRRELFEKDLRKNIDSDIVKKHYEHYKNHCRFSRKEPIGLDEWKLSEIKKLDEKNKSDKNI